MAGPERDFGIPEYTVQRSGGDAIVKLVGTNLVARVVAVVPKEQGAGPILEPSEDQFKDPVRKAHGVFVLPLHKVGDNALVFVISAGDPGAREKLDAAEQTMAGIANIWHNPQAGLEAIFPGATREGPSPYDPLLK